MLATVAQPPSRKPLKKKQEIPKALIYEIIDGKPIYYQGYREVLSKQKTIEEVMGSSRLQTIIIGVIIAYLNKILANNYLVLTNELGLHISHKSNLSIDIAIFDTKQLQNSENNDKYFDIPPKIAFEIDTDADLEFLEDGVYFHTKTQKLLNFGVEKVVWYFTKSQKVMVASPNQSWTTDDWSKTVEVIDSVKFSLTDLLAEKGITF